MRSLALVLLGTVGLSFTPASAEPGDHDFDFHHDTSERSDFDRAIDRAAQDARDGADRESSERAAREADANREGLDHDGLRVDVADGVSVGGDVDPSEGRAEVNIRIDTDSDPD